MSAAGLKNPLLSVNVTDGDGDATSPPELESRSSCWRWKLQILNRRYVLLVLVLGVILFIIALILWLLWRPPTSPSPTPSLVNTCLAPITLHILAADYLAVTRADISGLNSSSPSSPSTLSTSQSKLPSSSFLQENPSVNSSNIIGRLAMSCQVDATGAFGCTFALDDVPPGSAGISPHISLNLNSNQRTNGPMGIQAMLGGISSIHRCPRTFAQDGFLQSISFDANDAVCLDGNRLVLVNRTSTQSEYRIQFDNGGHHLRIVGHWNASLSVGGPFSFTVWLGNGERRLFGHSLDSRIMYSPSIVNIWLIEKEVDSNGNYIHFQYSISPSSQIAWIQSIAYTGNDRIIPPLLPYNQITFEYENRSDITTMYAAGQTYFTDRILRSISTWNDAHLVSRYQLDYNYSCADGSAHLTQINRCASTGECLSPTTVLWHEECESSPILFSSNFSYPIGDVLSQARFELNALMVADLDGDGVLDQFMTALNGTTSHSIALNDGQGHFHILPVKGLPVLTTDPMQNIARANVELGDLQLLDFHTSTALFIMRCDIVHGHDDFYIWDRQSSNVTFTLIAGPALVHDCSTLAMHQISRARIKFGDFNGDGWVDVLYVASPSIVYFNLGNGQWIAEVGPLFVIRDYFEAAMLDLDRIQVMDMNGDGLDDIYVIECEQPDTIYMRMGGINQTWSTNSTGAMTVVSCTLSRLSLDIERIHLIDVNRDGQCDVVYVEDRGGITIFINRGIRDFVAQFTPVDFILRNELPLAQLDLNRMRFADVSGDTRMDIVIVKQDGSLEVWMGQGNLQFVRVNTSLRFPLPATTVQANQALSCIRIGQFASAFGQEVMHVATSTVCQPGEIVNHPKQGQGISVYSLSFRPMQLVGVQDGYGQQVRVHYEPMTNASVYSRIASPLRSPEMEMISSSVSLVSQLYKSNGLSCSPSFPMELCENSTEECLAAGQIECPGYVTYSYHYSSHILHLRGWGDLGYGAVSIEQHILTVEERYTRVTVQHYSQAWQNLTQGLLLLTAEYLETDTTSTPLQLLRRHYNISGLTGSIPVRCIRLTESEHSTSWDLVGGWLSTSHRYISYDNNGNVINETIVERDSYGDYVTVAINEYDQLTDPAHYLIHLRTQQYEMMQTRGLLASNRTTRWKYDPSTGIVVQQIEWYNTVNQLNSDYTYNDYGSQVSIRVSAPYQPRLTARYSHMLFDELGRFVIARWNNLNHTSFSEIEGSTGRLLKSTDANGLDVQYRYDPFGRVIQETTPDAIVVNTTQIWCSSLRHSIFSRLDSADMLSCPPSAKFVALQSSSNGQLSINYYDKLGRVIRLVVRSFDNQYKVIDTEYDTLGRVLRTSEPYFLQVDFSIQGNSSDVVWTYYRYDALNRLIGSVAADGGRSQVLYNGSIVKNTNALLQWSEKVVNMKGWLLSLKDSRGGVLIFTYDSRGNRLSSFNAISNFSTDEFWDEYGRRVSMTDPHIGTITYAYSIWGHLIEQTHTAIGSTVRLEYDLLDRMVRREYQQYSAAPERTEWTYDSAPHALGKLVSIQRSDGYQQAFAYDTLGRLTQQTVVDQGDVFATNITYTSASQVESITFPTSIVLRHQYSTYDASLESLWDNTQEMVQLWKILHKDERDQVTEALYGDNIFALYAHDPFSGRLLQHIVTVKDYLNATRVVVHNKSYEWDLLGNLFRKDDHLIQRGERYEYDQANQVTLTEVYSESDSVSVLSQQRIQYTADANILYKSDVGHYHYGSAGPHAVTSITSSASIDSTPIIQVSYNAAGSMTSLRGFSLEYNAQQLVTRISRQSDQQVVSFFRYDSNDKLLEYLNGHCLTRHLSPLFSVAQGCGVQQPVVGSTVAASSVEYRHSIGPVGSISLMGVVAANGQSGLSLRMSSRLVSYFITDHLQTVEKILSSDGRILEQRAYDVFGLERNASTWLALSTSVAVDDSPCPNITDIGFTGHIPLSQVGFHHLGGRLLDPLLGRFNRPDLSVQFPEHIQDHNRYAGLDNMFPSKRDADGYSIWGRIWHGIEHIFRAVYRAVDQAIIHTLQDLIKPQTLLRAILDTIATPLCAVCGALMDAVYTTVVTKMSGGSLGDAFLQGLITGVEDVVGYDSHLTSFTNPERYFIEGTLGAVSAKLHGQSLVAGWVAGSMHTGVPTLDTKTLVSNPVSFLKHQASSAWLSAAFDASQTLASDIAHMISKKLSVDEFDGILLAISVIGPYRPILPQSTVLSGVDNRGYLYPLDAVDVILSLQGIPTGTGFYVSLFQPNSITGGHSEGALDVAILHLTRLLPQHMDLFALPFSFATVSGTTVYTGTKDLVAGFSGMGGVRMMLADPGTAVTVVERKVGHDYELCYHLQIC